MTDGIQAFTAELQRIRAEREAAEAIVVAEPVAEQPAVAEPAAEPVAEPAQEPAAEPAAEPAVEAPAEPEIAVTEKGQPVFKAIAVNDTTGVIVGIGAYADYVDLDDEVVNKADLVNMSYAFCASNERRFKANHKEEIACDLVASWPGAPILKSGAVLKNGEPIPDNDPVVGISLEKGAETAWFIAVRPHDKSFADKAREGGVAGFSWSGVVTRTPKE